MATTELAKTESLEEAKERIHKAFRPSDGDPVVRFIGENGKMGLRHIFSEEVVEKPAHDFIEMPEAEEAAKTPSPSDIQWEREREAKEHLPEGYKIPYNSDTSKKYTPFIDFVLVESADKLKGVINAKGEILVPAIYDRVFVETWQDEENGTGHYLTTVYGTRKDDKYGYVSLDGKEVIANQYEDRKEALKQALAQGLPESEIPAWDYQWHTDWFTYSENGKYGLQTLKGNRLTEAIFTAVKGQWWVGDCHLFEVRQKINYGDDDIAGLFDDKGQEVLPCKYYEDDLTVDAAGFIFARKKKKQGVFGLDGKPVVKCAYSDCRLEDGNVIAAYTSKDVTLFNTLGQLIIDKGLYDKVQTFGKDGLLTIRDMDCNWWYIDLWGNRMEMK